MERAVVNTLDDELADRYMRTSLLGEIKLVQRSKPSISFKKKQ